MHKAGIDRLDLAEAVLAQWESIEALGATAAENLRLVEAEVRNLAHYRQEDPERVDDLMQRFKVLAERLRQQVN